MADPDVNAKGTGPKKRRLSRKTWLIIVGVFLGMAFIGSLLPDRPPDQDAAPVAGESPSASYTIRGPQGTVPETPFSSPATRSPATVAAPVDPAAEANDWWFNRKGFLIGGYVELLSEYVQQARSGDLSSAAVTCSQLERTEISAIPTPNPVFGQDVVTMFDLGSGGLLIAADKCQEFFEKQDVKDLDRSLQMAGDGANGLNGVRTEIYEKHIKLP